MKFGSKKALFIAFVTIAGFGTYRLGTHIFGAQQFRFSLDPKLSPSMQKAIKQAVYESYITALSSLSEVIHKACPALEHTSIERRANNKLYISAKSMEPYVRFESHNPVRLDRSSEGAEWRGLPSLRQGFGGQAFAEFILSQSKDRNERAGIHPEPCRRIDPNGEENTRILTTSGMVLDASCFIQEVVQPLPVIIQKNLLGKATITDEFKRWLLRLDPSVFAFYHIIWTDDFSIELHAKHDEKQTILCSVITVPDTNIRELCQRIFDEKIICAQGTARKYVYTADIRFEKQIIICSHKGGACHG
jgi:hypothetical protein